MSKPTGGPQPGPEPATRIPAADGAACTLLSTFAWWLLVVAVLLPVTVQGQEKPNATSSSPPPPIVLTVEGTNVWIHRFQSNLWESAYPKQVLREKDRGRTGVRSRTSVRLSDLSVIRIDERSEFEIQPLPDPQVEAEFSLWRGLMYLLNRDRPGKHRFVTPTATAATRGTEFTLEVKEDTGRTILTVLEGEAQLQNEAGSIIIASGEQGVADFGQRPVKTAVIDTTNIVQWCLYYPGVLDLEELELAPADRELLEGSLSAYRSGDLLTAVSAYPPERQPISDDEKVYLAALLLSVGQVAQTEKLLASLSDAPGSTARARRLADSLRLVIAAVKRRSAPVDPETALSPPLATEQLARSYFEQSEYRLRDALSFARDATRQSPRFAFAWARVAELEFAQGNRPAAMAALERSLALAPRNAQAIALKGFLLTAKNRLSEALEAFDQAIAIDGGLGNAWLGRGLCRIRQGKPDEGRFDLHMAALAEPRRSLLRSYLGKAFNNDGDAYHAENELRLAAELDTGDPTPWLYSALLRQQQNRINEGIRDLEHSQSLNDNRRVYRSRLLLDQDRAVRGANLANLYRDAGLREVSAREAARAVNADYANYSAHLFLANSLNELRDPNQANLRYETPWFTEYLVANLLAPAGAGTLSPAVSQQEYSRLLERDRLGIFSRTEYASHGEILQSAVQYGNWRDSSYAAQFTYHSDNGWHPNGEIEAFTTLVELKHQLTPADGLYFQVTYDETEFGDVAQRYDPSSVNRGLEVKERREPFLIAGYHHEWSPGNHTLLLAGRLEDSFLVDNPAASTIFTSRFAGAPLSTNQPGTLLYDQDYRLNQVLYSAELQQIWQRQDHTVVLGGRVQHAEYDQENTERNGLLVPGNLPVAFPITQNLSSDVDRYGVYAYDHWQIWPTLILAGGLSYDRVEFPENYRYAPLSDRRDSEDQLSPKAGFIFTPTTTTTIRGAYFEALGGVSLEQSVRLEPSQVAGFNQAFRSLIPESVTGPSSAPSFDGWSLSLEQKLGTGTFVAVSGEILSSEVRRRRGVVDFQIPAPPNPASGFSTLQTREEFDYRERSLAVTLNQLLSDEWSFGLHYRLSQAELEHDYLDLNPVPGSPAFGYDPDVDAILHQLTLSAFYNHPSGFFAGAWTTWTSQSNHDYTTDIPGDDFWQFNVQAGWRFLQRRLEARVALLNLTDRDYRLNPLNLTSEAPRGREVVASLALNF